MENTVNIAVQLLPKSKEKDAYEIIDKAIEFIQQSGVKYEVCPFETVLEGDYVQLMNIVEGVQRVAFEHGASEVIVNLKIQRAKANDIRIDDKMWKYRE